MWRKCQAKTAILDKSLSLRLISVLFLTVLCTPSALVVPHAEADQEDDDA